MKEVFERLGIDAEMWIVSFWSATLFAIYRIYEPETMPTRRKIVSTILMGAISALLVPGLVIHFFNIENVFVAGAVTGITVYGFEQIVTIARSMVLNKIKNKDDGNGS